MKILMKTWLIDGFSDFRLHKKLLFPYTRISSSIARVGSSNEGNEGFIYDTLTLNLIKGWLRIDKNWHQAGFEHYNTTKLIS